MRTLWQRLRPFIRRDLRGRLISAAIAALVIAGLGWLGISAFTHLDSSEAKSARIQLGLESPLSDCTDDEVAYPNLPGCVYDDRAQAKVDEAWTRDLRIRASILHELDLRLQLGLDNLDSAEALLDIQELDFANYRPAAGDRTLAELLELPDISPLRYQPLEVDDVQVSDLLDAATYDPQRDLDGDQTRKLLTGAIADMRQQLRDHQQTVARQRAREPEAGQVPAALLDRRASVIDLQVDTDHLRFAAFDRARTWFEEGKAEGMSRSAFNLANAYPADFEAALNPTSLIWDGGWQLPTWEEHHPATLRYASPVDDDTRNALIGSFFLLVAAVVFALVGPVVTATATAREREAGTLPVLRMTGMSAGDLALAMILGPNAFALALGSAMLLAGVGLLAISGGSLGGLAMAVTLILVLGAATHLTAIGLGDALGQRVNAMVVGGLLGVGVLVPGLLGAGLTTFKFASAGLLLGPLPALVASVTSLSGVQGVGLHEGSLTQPMLFYAVAVQLLLGVICLSSWRRRVEQGWAPLFKPSQGIALAVASIGCSALTLLDISEHHVSEDFDALNLLTFLSSAFLLPVLAWLLVASLRRPARARAVADFRETRQAFLRFQGFILVTATLVGLSYHLVMTGAGLQTEDSEVMWATLTQLLLVAETGVATLLWASRRKQGKLRVAFLGSGVVIMQLVAVLGTYGAEVEHVALRNTAAMPLLLNTQVTPYWLAFLVLCWAAGLTLIFTALLRRRDERIAAARQAAQQADEPEDDDDYGMPGRRLLH
ncbi:hypothetical protein G6O69_32880 [Pseudenhygromyxa sp. WMMC2535]|uniref:hypothetical protein n=1 Tax=Pseudenhygromyxa sp. WMMC2535 TaxID=2712867 RepID=UPI0015528AD4|nr:hypothetical protein [Pseudenhygromyxa sp. WMMC2535]NVB42663.1 hypothetical protein [Pseudenhygromyxa sp. WMMC2535]